MGDVTSNLEGLASMLVSRPLGLLQALSPRELADPEATHRQWVATNRKVGGPIPRPTVSQTSSKGKTMGKFSTVGRAVKGTYVALSTRASAAVARAAAKAMAAKPELAFALAKRLGVTAATSAVATSKAVLAHLKANPLSAGLIVWEVYQFLDGDDKSVVDQERVDGTDQTVLDMVTSMFGTEDDEVSDDMVSGFISIQDELAAINNASARLGGIQSLLNLRRVLAMDENLFKLYAIQKSSRI